MIPKFRAWDKVNERIVEVSEINFWTKVIDTTDTFLAFSNVELLQSTGLFDKNGKLIYEGDIVHIKSSDGIDYKALIIFKDGGFCAIDGTEGSYSVLRRRLTDSKLFLEVLGNKFEHPHLLEED